PRTIWYQSSFATTPRHDKFDLLASTLSRYFPGCDLVGRWSGPEHAIGVPPRPFRLRAMAACPAWKNPGAGRCRRHTGLVCGKTCQHQGHHGQPASCRPEALLSVGHAPGPGIERSLPDFARRQTSGTLSEIAFGRPG